MSFSVITRNNAAVQELARDPLIEQFAPGCSATLKQEAIERIVTTKLKELLAGTRTLSPTDKVQLLDTADSILSRWKVTKTPPKNIQEMERCTLAVRHRLPLYLTASEAKIKQLEESVRLHQEKLLKKWTGTYHMSPDIFFAFPDFVDFVFASHLHKALQYHGEQITMVSGEPTILVDGIRRPWKEIKAKFFVEKGKMYSMENGEKKRWEYLSRGLTCYDPAAWVEPKPIKVLAERPGHYSLVVVTSHVPKSKQNFGDRIFEGARHAWFRVITPEGEIYSFGRGFNPADVNVFQPLAGVETVINCPDTYEYYAEHRLETTIPITQEQGERVLRLIKNHARGADTFNIINNNCTNFTKEVLEAADIRNIKLEEHVSGLLFDLFIPAPIGKTITSVWDYIMGCFMLSWVQATLIKLKNFVVSLGFMPLFTLLGAWYVRNSSSRRQEPASPVATPPASPPMPAPVVPPTQGERRIEIIRQSLLEMADEEIEWVQRQARPLYASFWDAFNSDKLTFTLPNLLAKWQREQGDRTRFY